MNNQQTIVQCMERYVVIEMVKLQLVPANHIVLL